MRNNDLNRWNMGPFPLLRFKLIFKACPKKYKYINHQHLHFPSLLKGKWLIGWMRGFLGTVPAVASDGFQSSARYFLPWLRVIHGKDPREQKVWLLHHLIFALFFLPPMWHVSTVYYNDARSCLFICYFMYSSFAPTCFVIVLFMLEGKLTARTMLNIPWKDVWCVFLFLFFFPLWNKIIFFQQV